MIEILEHQKKSLFKIKKLIRKKNKGLLLFHSLGSGKTITTLNIIKYFIKKNKTFKFYIICSKYLFTNWKKESSKINLNYTKYLLFIDINNINSILDITPGINKMIIIDEAHIILSKYLRNSQVDILKKEKLYKTLYSCFFTIYITGTPIIENITDLNIFENLCSNKNLLTNDKNLYPEYFKVNQFLFILFNKIFPILKKYTYQAPFFTIVNLMSTFIIIYLELYHDSLFDEFHKFISYLKYKNDFIGRNIFLPLKKKIEENNDDFNEKQLEEEMKYDPEYIQFQKKVYNIDIQNSNKELSDNYIKIKKKIIKKTKISYYIKIIFGIYYSVLSVTEIIRDYYIKNNKIVKFNYKKFLKNIISLDKYVVSTSNKNFPNKKIYSEYIYLNKKQTDTIVDAIINKDFIIKNCIYKNKILCDLYNIDYKKIPIDIILQISNVFNSLKFEHLLNIIYKYKNFVVVSCRYNKNSLKLIQKYLTKKKIKYDILYPNSKNNHNIITDFENRIFDVLLLHPEIIEGISIKNTKALVLFDVCQKYNIEQQVIGRCVRYNSHLKSIVKEVHIYKFVSVFYKKFLIKSLKKVKDPSQSFNELLRDKSKIKFLTQLKSPDEIFEDANKLVEKIYDRL